MRLDQFIAGAMQQVGPEVLAQFMNMGDYLARRATALGLVTDGLIKSQEQIEAERQQMMQAQMVNQLGPDAMKLAAQASQEEQQTDG